MLVARITLLLFLPCATWAAVGAPAENKDGLLVASPAAVSLHEGPLDSLTPQVVDAEFPETTSLLVFKNDRLVYERYFGAGGINVLNDTRSATKTLTALVAGRAIFDGTLRSAEQPVFPLFAELAPFRHDGDLKQDITLLDLLTMTSALDCDDSDPSSAGNETSLQTQTNWTRAMLDLPVKTGYQRGPNGRGPFSYCTGGVFLLGQALQRAARLPLDRYFDTRLLLPLGIRQREWSHSPGGELQAGAGLRLRSRDLLKLGVLILDKGDWQGTQLVPADWIRRMQTVSNVVDEQKSYGMLYWQRQYDSPCGRINGWYMSGYGGSVVVNLPLQSMVVVVTRTRYRHKAMHEETVRLLEQHVFAALPCS